jgi:hypothetical protein
VVKGYLKNSNRSDGKLSEGVQIRKVHIAVNLSFADWTGLEQAGLYGSNAICYEGGDWVVTELRPGERAGIKIPICRFVCSFIS